MKKKIIFGIFVLATLAINLMTVSKTNVNDLSLICLMQTTKVQAEELDFCGAMWTVTYTFVGGTTSITCAAGGLYKCPFC